MKKVRALVSINFLNLSENYDFMCSKPCKQLPISKLPV